MTDQKVETQDPRIEQLQNSLKEVSNQATNSVDLVVRQKKILSGVMDTAIESLVIQLARAEQERDSAVSRANVAEAQLKKTAQELSQVQSSFDMARGTLEQISIQQNAIQKQFKETESERDKYKNMLIEAGVIITDDLAKEEESVNKEAEEVEDASPRVNGQDAIDLSDYAKEKETDK